MTAHKIPLSRPIFDEEMKRAALDALENDRYVLGENVWKFEEEFARYVRAKYAVSTSSGTHALHFALVSCGVSKGVNAITTAFSFVATANAIVHAGGEPAFVDIHPPTCNISPIDLQGKVDVNTRVVLPVHLYGFPADMDEIVAIAEERNLCVVEDACQAHGAEYKGRKVGSIGTAGCFSFYPSKNMSVLGDGGMVVTNDEGIASAVLKLRDAGRKAKYEHDVIGFTARLNSVNAAIGRCQLRKLDVWNERRRKIAELYAEELKELQDRIKLPPKRSSEVKPVFHLFVIRISLRDALKDWLEKSGIECGIHYPIPIPLQPIYKKLYGFRHGDFPISEKLAGTCLSLPMHPRLCDDDVRFVCEQIEGFYKRLG